VVVAALLELPELEPDEPHPTVAVARPIAINPAVSPLLDAITRASLMSAPPGSVSLHGWPSPRATGCRVKPPPPRVLPALDRRRLTQRGVVTAPVRRACKLERIVVPARGREQGGLVLSRRALLAARLALSSCLLATGALAAPGRAAASSVSCRAGRTVFHRDGIRAFVINRKFEAGTQDSSNIRTFYVCSSALRRPRIFDQSAPFTFEGLYDYKLFGERLGFIYSSSGIQNGTAEGIGWVNLRTGRAKESGICESEDLTEGNEETPGLPHVPCDHVNYAIAADGTVAVLGEGGEPTEWEVAELADKPRSLGSPRRLTHVTAPAEGLDIRSLKITATDVTWSTKDDQTASAPR
jgi:hypothetical protein